MYFVLLACSDKQVKCENVGLFYCKTLQFCNIPAIRLFLKRQKPIKLPEAQEKIVLRIGSMVVMVDIYSTYKKCNDFAASLKKNANFYCYAFFFPLNYIQHHSFLPSHPIIFSAFLKPKKMWFSYVELHRFIFNLALYFMALFHRSMIFCAFSQQQHHCMTSRRLISLST